MIALSGASVQLGVAVVVAAAAAAAAAAVVVFRCLGQILTLAGDNGTHADAKGRISNANSARRKGYMVGASTVAAVTKKAVVVIVRRKMRLTASGWKYGFHVTLQLKQRRAAGWQARGGIAAYMYASAFGIGNFGRVATAPVLPAIAPSAAGAVYEQNYK